MVSKCLLIFTAALVSITGTSGKGYVEINLKSFQNPQSFDRSGERCDKFGECDTFLHICLSDFGDTSGGTICSIGAFQTKAFQGQSSITFQNGTELGGGKTNPLLFPLDKWQSEVNIMVTAYDRDVGSHDDLIDILDRSICTLPSPNASQATIHLIEMKGRYTTLKIEVKIYCDEKSSGRNCEITSA